MSGKTVLKAENISVSIGRKTILDSISFELEKGGIYALVGKNGAGKSTLIRALLGLEPNTKGSLELFGTDKLTQARKRVGAMLSADTLPLKKTGRRYLTELCMLVGCGYDEIERVSALTGAGSFLGQKTGSYSYGMKQRLSLAGALVGSPELVFLDEPFKGLDPEAAGQLQMTVSGLAREGVTAVITDHILSILLDLGCEFLVLDSGRLTHRLTCQQLEKDPLNVKRFTLGGGILTDEAFAVRYPEYCGIARGNYVDVIEPNGREVPDTLIEGCTSVERLTADREEMLIWHISGKDTL